MRRRPASFDVARRRQSEPGVASLPSASRQSGSLERSANMGDPDQTVTLPISFSQDIEK
jgi:hypothetical protein